MTMSAQRVEGTDNIQVRITYGPVEASVAENYQHLRWFHSNLGQLLEQAEAEAKAKAASEE